MYQNNCSQHIGFLAWLELLLESGPSGPKRVPHRRPVKQTNKQTAQKLLDSEMGSEIAIQQDQI